LSLWVGGVAAEALGDVVALIARALQLSLRVSNLLEPDLDPVFAVGTGAILGDVRVVVAGGGNATSANRPDRVGENEGTA
jgi:hypothetical protein